MKPNFNIHNFLLVVKGIFWFLTGMLLGFFFFASLIFFVFQQIYKNVVYPGVIINGVDFGGKKETDVENYFRKKNEKIGETKFVFIGKENNITVSAKEIDFGYDYELLGKQAYSIGRAKNSLSDISLIFQSYVNGIYLTPSYHYSEEKLFKILDPAIKQYYIAPVNALFTFENGRVTAFQLSSDGQEVDIEKLKNEVTSKTSTIVYSSKPQTISITIPTRIIKPKTSTNEVNNLGVQELIASGTSLFQGSIPSRVYNIKLASSRLNGILVAPNEVFSFNDALGDVSSFTGYQQAYIISNGRTVLGDGGGVCQVSTTLFRAVLNAGLPVIERHAHAYRVGYYEQDLPPGFDATVYSPTVDFKFKNDTGKYILIQTSFDEKNLQLTFSLYGTKDTRQVTIGKPVITSQSPAPEPVYQDDPTLEKGVVKQVDFAAGGLSTYFTRTVSKNGKTIINDKFVSNFQPWHAVYLRGTKE